MNEIEVLEFIKDNKKVDEIYLDYWVCKSIPYAANLEGGKLYRSIEPYGWETFKVDWNFIGPIIERDKLQINYDSETKAWCVQEENESNCCISFDTGKDVLINLVKRAIIIKHYSELRCGDNHNYISAKNQIITSGYSCLQCGSLISDEEFENYNKLKVNIK